VAQDAFAKASFHWARIAAYDQPEAWVRRVAFNQAYNSTRRARRWPAGTVKSRLNRARSALAEQLVDEREWVPNV
jgi:RNA polymerase sigma-70 factor, ECF subfamily